MTAQRLTGLKMIKMNDPWFKENKTPRVLTENELNALVDPFAYIDSLGLGEQSRSFLKRQAVNGLVCRNLSGAGLKMKTMLKNASTPKTLAAVELYMQGFILGVMTQYQMYPAYRKEIITEHAVANSLTIPLDTVNSILEPYFQTKQ